MIDGYKVADPEGTPESREYGWTVGFGLQRADGLEPSGYAREVAKRQIDGDITYARAADEIERYHRDNPDEAGHREADVVAQRISELLQTPAFAFSPAALRMIHGRLFAGVLPDGWTGAWRSQNITKAEPVLNGESVQYSDFVWIEPTLEYDFGEERARQGGYQRADDRAVAGSVFSFLSGIWQIHPFREGNTRTTAAFGILYLRSLGFQTDNRPFAEHSQYFRDALALANASDRTLRDDRPLHRFMDAALFDPTIELGTLRHGLPRQEEPSPAVAPPMTDPFAAGPGRTR